MLRPMFAAASVVTLVAWTATAGAQPAPAELAQKAKAVLQANCYKCHGDGGRAEAGMFVLNYQKLIDAKKIVPNNLKGSKLYKRLAVEEDMPPETDDDGKSIPRPSKDDVLAIKAWIEAGAPSFAGGAAPERAFISNSDMLKSILADLVKANERERRFLRYFTITHLYNAGLSDDELVSYRVGLSKLINSLSWGRDIQVPQPIDAAKTIFRIDLRDLEWDETLWDEILAANPYGVTYKDETAKACYAYAQTPLPYVRADWFVFAASKPPLYYRILRLPDTVAALESRLELDADRDIRQERVWRAAFNGSGVSRNNRLIERHRSPFGAYWKSYDFAGNVGRKNLFQYPLGPGHNANEFQHDGGELIFNLPNGLQAYFLADANGKRLDRGPTNIVSDAKQADRAVLNGVSCMSCHSQGMIAKDDQIRIHVENNPKAFEKTERDLILTLYPKKEVFDAKLKEDAERFQKAVIETGAHLSKTEPVYVLAKLFENEVNMKLAAAEAGVSVAEFRQGLERSATLARVFGPLKSAGGTVQRDALVASFGDLVHELQPKGAVFTVSGGSPTANVAAPAPFPPDKRNEPPIKRNDPPIYGPIERPEPIVFKPYLPKNEREVVTLPAPAIDATVGGGGRYLIFQATNSLAIFDVQAGAVVKQLPLVEDNALIAAGATRLFALYPNSKTLQSWNLTTFAKEKRVALPDAMTRDNIHEISMGSASNGPLFVYLPKEKRTLAMNPATLQTTQVNWKHWSPSNAYGPLNMRTAPDGSVLIGWDGGWAGAEAATFRDGVQTGSNDQFGFSMGPFALPSADGQRLFIPDAIDGIDGTASKAPELGNAYAVPAHELGFYMILRTKNRGPVRLSGQFGEYKVKLAPVGEVVVYSDDRHRLFSLSDVDGMENGSNIYWERCVHYYPSAGLLVVLAAPDRLVLRRVDLVQQMEKAAANYLVVVSQPTIAKVGGMWDYRLDVKSKAGQVKAALESGPEGMTVTPDGQVKWLVPNDFVEPFATVKVSLEDAGGQETRHQFRVAVSSNKK